MHPALQLKECQITWRSFCYSYNVISYSEIGFSLFYVMFGRKAVLPVDCLLVFELDEDVSVSYDDFKTGTWRNTSISATSTVIQIHYPQESAQWSRERVPLSNQVYRCGHLKCPHKIYHNFKDVYKIIGHRDGVYTIELADVTGPFCRIDNPSENQVWLMQEN